MTRRLFALFALAALAGAQQRGGIESWVDPDRSEPAGMRYRTFASEAAGGEVSYLIYLPPGYETESGKRYPVIYWLHGLNGRQAGSGRLVERLDPAIRAGRMPAVIVVGVNGLRASMYSNSKDGRWPLETVIARDLPRHIDETYRTIAGRRARALEGMSMGGYGVLRLAAKYPETFGVVSSYAAALHTEETLAERRRAIFDGVYGGDAAYARQNTPWTLTRQNAPRMKGRLRMRLMIGAADGLLEWNRQFHRLLEDLGIEHEYIEIEGVGHNYAQLAGALGERSIEFYRRAFEDGK